MDRLTHPHFVNLDLTLLASFCLVLAGHVDLAWTPHFHSLFLRLQKQNQIRSFESYYLHLRSDDLQHSIDVIVLQLNDDSSGIVPAILECDSSKPRKLFEASKSKNQPSCNMFIQK